MDPKSFSFLDGDLVLSSDEIISRTKPKHTDVVIVSGTLVEGIGNCHSDIDVYVIGDDIPSVEKIGPRNYTQTETDKVRVYYDYLAEGGYGFDVEYYTKSEVLDMASQVNDFYEMSLSSTKTMRAEIPRRVLDALHKIKVGECLQNEQDLNALFEGTLWEKLCFVLYRNKIGGYPEFKDIMGPWKSGDLDTAIENTRGYLLTQAAALCHLAGSTNFKSKWTIQSLKRLPERFMQLSEDIITWLRSGRTTAASQYEGVLSACDLIERIFRATSSLLDENRSIGFDCQQAMVLTEEEYQLEAFHDQQTAHEFEYRFRQFSETGRNIRTFITECA